MPPRKKPKKQRRHKVWCFTDFDVSEERRNALFELFADADYAFQEEICPDTGRHHLQGVVRFRNARAFGGVREAMGNVHLVPSAGGYAKSYTYCTKERTRHAGPWTRGPVPQAEEKFEPIDFFDPALLQPWQSIIFELIKGPPDRRDIWWFWDEKGGTGKSTIARHLILKHGAYVFSGRAADMHYGLAQLVQKGISPRIVIIDIPRSNAKYVSWAGIEKIKDATLYSTKYESCAVVFNPGHLICFANFAPPYDKFSDDRWRIVQIDQVEPRVLEPEVPLPRAALGAHPELFGSAGR